VSLYDQVQAFRLAEGRSVEAGPRVPAEGEVRRQVEGLLGQVFALVEASFDVEAGDP